MKFSDSRESNNIENLYDEFLIELDNEYNHIQVYFADLFSYSKEKEKSIVTEFLNEDAEIKLSLLKQPNYSLYTKKFDDLLAKSIIVTLLSNFEFNLIRLIEMLVKNGYIKIEFKRPRNRIIYNCLEFLYNNSPIEKNSFGYEAFEIFIRLRNSIVHNNSEINDEILNNANYALYKDFIIVDIGYFHFKDVLINYHLTKTIRTFFNSLASSIK